jgi:hypothetical protein
MDPPPSNSIVGLVNNLDLVVVVTSADRKSQLYVGNQKGEGEWDDLNNVEQVSITDLSSSTTDVVVHVRATMASEMQNYSLAVSGNLKKTDSCTSQCRSVKV